MGVPTTSTPRQSWLLEEAPGLGQISWLLHPNTGERRGRDCCPQAKDSLQDKQETARKGDTKRESPACGHTLTAAAPSWGQRGGGGRQRGPKWERRLHDWARICSSPHSEDHEQAGQGSRGRIRPGSQSEGVLLKEGSRIKWVDRPSSSPRTSHLSV